MVAGFAPIRTHGANTIRKRPPKGGCFYILLSYEPGGSMPPFLPGSTWSNATFTVIWRLREPPPAVKAQAQRICAIKLHSALDFF